jgi:uncharacterized RDD family membrane protein YckC
VVMLPAKFCNACGHVLSTDAARGNGSEIEIAGARDVAPPDPPAPDPPAHSAAHAQAMAEPAAAPAPVPAPSPARAAAPAMAIAPPPRREAPRISARPPAPPSTRGPRSLPPRPVAVGPTGTASLAGPVTDAGFGVRLVAGVIDLAIVSAIQALLLAPVARHWWSRELPATPADVPYFPILVSIAMVPVALVLGAAYYAFFWGLKGATPGKRVLGLTVAAEDGTTPIGMSRATLRVLGYLASGLLLGIGFLMIAFGGTALHDRIAGTRVVRRGTVA